MYQILKAEKLADKIYLMEVEAPRVARSCEPGEFVIVRIDEEGERIPLTICDYDREQGTVTIVFQTVGASTERMALLKEGDTFRDFVGPLGNPSDFVKEDPEELKKKRILYVAGGVRIIAAAVVQGTRRQGGRYRRLQDKGSPDSDKGDGGAGGESLHNNG